MFISSIFQMLGYPHNLLGAEYDWLGETPSAGICSAVSSLPVSEEEFLKIDLNAHAIATVLSEEQFSTLKSWQCERIRALRAAAYREEADGLFFNAAADDASRDAWLAQRIQIKNRYPWPGTYR